MQALIFDKTKSWKNSKGFELADVPMPKLLKDDDVIIKVHYAGVCGTDKGIWHRQAFRDLILGSINADKRGQEEPRTNADEENDSTSPHPSPGLGRVPEGRERSKKSYRIIGHEFFGEVVEVGKAVKNIKKGDFVTCESHVVCNECYQCLHGEKHVCTNEKILGISQDGGFAEYIRVPSYIAWKTDTAKVRPEVAAVQEPFGNAVHAASKVDLKNKTIAIFGLGPIGMSLLLVARGMGARQIIGVEPNPIAAEMAKKLGIDYVIPLKNSPNPSLEKRGTPSLLQREGGGEFQHDPAVTEEIMKITKGLGVDVAFEMAGFNSSMNNAIFATRRGGDVILFGLKNGDFVLEDYNKLIFKGLTLHAVIGRQIWQTWERTQALLEDATNGIQEKIFNIILARGEGTILPISEYTKERFEQMMAEHPKFLIQF